MCLWNQVVIEKPRSKSKTHTRMARRQTDGPDS
jgi:hypothetical protein